MLEILSFQISIPTLLILFLGEVPYLDHMSEVDWDTMIQFSLSLALLSIFRCFQICKESFINGRLKDGCACLSIKPTRLKEVMDLIMFSQGYASCSTARDPAWTTSRTITSEYTLLVLW